MGPIHLVWDHVLVSFFSGLLQLLLVPSPVQVAARAPCDVFDPWVRWERGQAGI